MDSIHHGSRQALDDGQLQRNLGHTLSHTLEARDKAVGEVGNWEELRRHAQQVKLHTLSRLDRYLEQLEGNILQAGGKVHWAADAAEANRIVLEIAAQARAGTVVKSKSMAGEEIGLNHALQQAGVTPIETDLGEYIVQLADEAPSHIIAPALHKSRGQVAQLFAEHLGISPDSDIEALTAAARKVLRRQFLTADLGISGANFAIAETGTIVVVENEGNARLSTSAPRVHIAVMGIEKVIPRTRDLAVFLKLLIRSATGQKMTSYLNFLTGPRREGEADGPEEFHLVLLDNGRSRAVGDPSLGPVLSCIRCGACQNICPVYQRIGGHAYGSVYQGPIGAILTPILDPEATEHPFASSLCGACREVCPVRIDIPHILLELRRRSVGRDSKQPVRKTTRGGRLERIAFRLWARAASDSRRFDRIGRWSRRLGRHLPRPLLSAIPALRRWLTGRDLPELPRRSFRERLRNRTDAER